VCCTYNDISLCKLVRLLQLLVVTSYKLSINPIINPNLTFQQANLYYDITQAAFRHARTILYVNPKRQNNKFIKNIKALNFNLIHDQIVIKITMEIKSYKALLLCDFFQA
jgi:hypothetical protein